jgi:hypothetical protein
MAAVLVPEGWTPTVLLEMGCQDFIDTIGAALVLRQPAHYVPLTDRDLTRIYVLLTREAVQ